MTSKQIFSSLPDATKCVFSILGTGLTVYGIAWPYLGSVVPAPVALAISGVVLLLTGVIHKAPQIEAVATDLANGDIVSALKDVQSALETNTTATASVSAALVQSPISAASTAPLQVGQP